MRVSLSATLAISVVVGTAVVIFTAFSASVRPLLFPQMFLFILLIASASLLHARDPAGGVVSPTASMFYAAIYLFDPITAFFLVALGYAIGNVLPRPWVTWRTFFNGAQMGMSALVGGIIYRTLGGDPASTNFASQILPSLLAPLAHQATNNFFIAFLISRMRRVSFVQTWISFIREFFWANFLSIPTSILIAVLYARVHEAFALVFIVILPLQRWAMQLVLGERNTYMRIIESLVRACELSFPGMRGHARRVADLSVAIGRRMALVEDNIEALEYAGLVHDIGMIGLEEELNSADAYLQVEYLIAEHVRLGAEIVSDLPRRELREIVLHHHAPYRREVRGKNESEEPISISARILALAEDVDSRLFGLFPYQSSYPANAVMESVLAGRGSLYDPAVVDAFLAVCDEGPDGVSGRVPSNLGVFEAREVVR